ncbi:MAG TPA: DUF2917 domain-containing protein [Caldimonas sp.]|nr:DUF2917 domain-containing protein [Caldimonas sp.]HEX4235846.1 DUF2917 domain-containing protein [Caldimonas sp.]
MDIRIDDSCFDLRKHQIMRFDDATGTDIVCLRGELWLTQDGDLRDIVLSAGEHFTLDCNGVALVSALRPSSVCVEVAVEAAPPWQDPGARARMAISGVRSAVLVAPLFAVRPQ